MTLALGQTVTIPARKGKTGVPIPAVTGKITALLDNGKVTVSDGTRVCTVAESTLAPIVEHTAPTEKPKSKRAAAIAAVDAAPVALKMVPPSSGATGIARAKEIAQSKGRDWSPVHDALMAAVTTEWSQWTRIPGATWREVMDLHRAELVVRYNDSSWYALPGVEGVPSGYAGLHRAGPRAERAPRAPHAIIPRPTIEEVEALRAQVDALHAQLVEHDAMIAGQARRIDALETAAALAAVAARTAEPAPKKVRATKSA